MKFEDFKGMKMRVVFEPQKDALSLVKGDPEFPTFFPLSTFLFFLLHNSV
jgi:hypothetical protein